MDADAGLAVFPVGDPQGDRQSGYAVGAFDHLTDFLHPDFRISFYRLLLFSISLPQTP